MANGIIGATWFEVRQVVTVDRPERRNVTLPVVAAGRRLPSSRYYATMGEAVRAFNDLVGGDEDFGSEFVALVEVVQRYDYRGARCVRRPVERERVPGTDRVRVAEVVS